MYFLSKLCFRVRVMVLVRVSLEYIRVRITPYSSAKVLAPGQPQVEMISNQDQPPSHRPPPGG